MTTSGKPRPRRGENPPDPSALRPGAAHDLEAPHDLKGIVFGEGGARYMLLSFPIEEAAAVPSLTTAEREVLEALLAGRSNSAIAEQRGTSSRTVANQVASLFHKFGASSRLDLARRASSMVVGQRRALKS